MKLERITLTDFRCFYGENVIDLAISDEKNVTLIHAENGVGKTTLLNALLWCFYKDTTPRFEKKNDIINHQAVAEGRTIASVTVEFSHNEKLYEAKRHFKLSDPQAQEKVSVAEIVYGADVPQTKVAPESFLNAVIPREMAGHFLFDGEHAEAISGEANRSGVARAMKDILGASIVSQTIHDLETAWKYYKRNAANASKDSGVDKLQGEIDKLDELVTKHKSEIEESERRLKQISQQSEDINSKLRDAKEIKDLQRRKEELERNLNQAKRRHIDSIAKQQIWLSENGRFVVANKLTSQSHDCLEGETTKGKIPAPYNEDFVTSLLEAKTCVCGRPLAEGGPEADKIAALLKSAATKELQDRIIKVRARIRQLSENVGLGVDGLKKAQRDENEEHNNIIRFEALLNEVREKIMGIDVEEISDRERKLQQLRGESEKHRKEIAGKTHDIKRYKQQISEREREIDKVTRESSEARKFLLRRDLTAAVKLRTEERLEVELEEARNIINRLMKQIIDSTSRKNFEVVVSQDFTVSLRNVLGKEMAKSEGENQLLGLTFTAALCKFAMLRKNAKNPFLLPGTEAPLVLDAPFGKLDSIYKVATAEFIPKMASQVILMVSKEQGSENVIEKLKDRIGEEYCLVSHSSGSQGEKSAESISIGGKEIPISVFDSSFEGTEIKRVE